MYTAPDISFAIDGVSEACEGDEITLEASATEEVDVAWDNGIVNAEPFNAIAGETTFTASAEYDGCQYSASITVEVQEAIESELNAGEDISLCGGRVVEAAAADRAGRAGSPRGTGGVPASPAGAPRPTRARRPHA